MTINPIVGNNIKLFRNGLGFTQDAFSEFLGISRTELNYYENGKRSVPISVISKSADIFGIDGYDLFEENPMEKSANLAFAFRVDSLSKEDLEEISQFKKIVKNYLKLRQLKKSDD